ncbi:MAG: MFS transporter [Deltaproteobacteria bacterium]|nr:MFS transporter [Deltaproteobacteria bacterium]
MPPTLGDHRRRVPRSAKLYYGAGAVAEGVVTTAFNVFLLFYYNQVLGLPGTLGGTAIFLALCIDAVADPLVGSISDNLRSRWGRRHPFMYASALPAAACFFLVFHPPAGLSHGQLFLWLAAFAVGVRVSMTLYIIPSDSLLPEMTFHYDERTSLVSYRFLFGWLGGLTIAQAGDGPGGHVRSADHRAVRQEVGHDGARLVRQRIRSPAGVPAPARAHAGQRAAGLAVPDLRACAVHRHRHHRDQHRLRLDDRRRGRRERAGGRRAAGRDLHGGDRVRR